MINLFASRILTAMTRVTIWPYKKKCQFMEEQTSQFAGSLTLFNMNICASLSLIVSNRRTSSRMHVRMIRNLSLVCTHEGPTKHKCCRRSLHSVRCSVLTLLIAHPLLRVSGVWSNDIVAWKNLQCTMQHQWPAQKFQKLWILIADRWASTIANIIKRWKTLAENSKWHCHQWSEKIVPTKRTSSSTDSQNSPITHMSNRWTHRR